MPHILSLIIHKLYIALLAVVVKFMPSTNSMVFTGENSSQQLCTHIARLGHQRVLLVTDKPLVELGLVNPVIEALQALDVDVVVFDGVLPDPTYDVVHAGLALQRQHDCDAVLAMGGGSSMDASKVIATLATNVVEPSTLVGYFKVKEQPVPLYALPTTSGTGSEATMGAVIADSVSHEKVIIADPKMLPDCAALDPALMTGLPPAITAATGMDALTHAIEAYIGVWGSPRSDGYACSAVKMIFNSLPVAYSNGDDIRAREEMALAAYYAGLAIGEANIGNVHAVAHQLGTRYGVPHGLANALVLPHVLKYSRHAAQSKLADLAVLIGLGDAQDSKAQLADKFIDAVSELNAKVGIPTKLDKLQRQDVVSIAKSAAKEGAGYPVPFLMSPGDSEAILYQLL